MPSQNDISGIKTSQNHPNLWQAQIPHPSATGHKYDRGHVVVFGGADMTGAARMAAQAAMRAGAGLCTIMAPTAESAIVYRSDAPHIMVEEGRDPAAALTDPRRNAVVIGPGLAEEGLKPAILAILATRRATVLDAGALTAFGDAPDTLLAALHENCVLTPHEGEFAKLFGTIGGNRAATAQEAAERCHGATMLLKGAETLICRAGQPAIVNDHATPYLATAGAGDVLAGLIAGLMAQGMTAPDAAAAAAWIHGEAARRFGPGLVAPDIIAGIPAVLQDFA